jgi:hypothetical protein
LALFLAVRVKKDIEAKNSVDPELDNDMDEDIDQRGVAERICYDLGREKERGKLGYH